MDGEQPEVARILRLLEALLVLRKIRLVALERHLGLSAGTIRRIFNGAIELKYRQVIEILEFLEIPPLAFFQIAYEPQNASVDLLAARLDKIRPAEEQKVEPLSRADLLELVKETLEQLGYSPPKKGAKKSPDRRQPPEKKDNGEE
ncbi:MAG TPA: hypothetical protein VGS07_09380 [Thermoanaerobaculia bacterium]|jgi:transcriptional regulator with XRE-family HTH domain|nr:hypothetical protein [Thermoanaerobaculia bacterium]